MRKLRKNPRVDVDRLEDLGERWEIGKLATSTTGDLPGLATGPSGGFERTAADGERA